LSFGDLTRLDNANELEDLVLDLAALKSSPSSGLGASSLSDSRVKSLGFLSLGRLPHSFNGIKFGLCDLGQVLALEWINKDGIGLCKSISSGARADLEVFVGTLDERALGKITTAFSNRSSSDCLQGSEEGDENGSGTEEHLGKKLDSWSFGRRIGKLK
jgi:hypothetical protein